MHPASVSSSRLKRNLASHRSQRRSTGSWWPWPRLAVKDNRPANQTDSNQPGRPQPSWSPGGLRWHLPSDWPRQAGRNHVRNIRGRFTIMIMINCQPRGNVMPFLSGLLFHISNCLCSIHRAKVQSLPCFVTSSLTKITALITNPTQAVLWSRFESSMRVLQLLPTAAKTCQQLVKAIKAVASS